MSMSLPQLAALVHGWAGTLHSDTREYYYNKPGHLSKQVIEADIKNARDALDLFEQELQKFDIFTDTITGEESE